MRSAVTRLEGAQLRTALQDVNLAIKLLVQAPGLRAACV